MGFTTVLGRDCTRKKVKVIVLDVYNHWVQVIDFLIRHLFCFDYIEIIIKLALARLFSTFGILIRYTSLIFGKGRVLPRNLVIEEILK